MNLFADDAIVYEPFSKIDWGLKDKDSIKPFLDVVMMENDGMRAKIDSVSKWQQRKNQTISEQSI